MQNQTNYVNSAINDDELEKDIRKISAEIK